MTMSGALTPTHTYCDNGAGNFTAPASPTGAGSPIAAFTVTLTVTDTTGLSAAETLVVHVANVAPVVNIRWWWAP